MWPLYLTNQEATLEFTQQSLFELSHFYAKRFLNSQISSYNIIKIMHNFFFQVEQYYQWPAGTDKSIVWIGFPWFLHFPDLKQQQQNCKREKVSSLYTEDKLEMPGLLKHYCSITFYFKNIHGIILPLDMVGR